MTDQKLPETIQPIDMAAQRSPDWFKARLGKVTASKVGDILATIRNGNYAASRKNYAAQLITERLSPENLPEPYTNEAMLWGIEQEPLALEAYRNKTGNSVEEVGFVDHPTIPMAGASPDGLVVDILSPFTEEGCLEIKCPTTATHIETLLAGEIPSKHRYQMLWQMACTGRKWCDFVSFDSRMPSEMQLFVKRFIPEADEVERTEAEVKVFLKEVEETIQELKEKFE